MKRGLFDKSMIFLLIIIAFVIGIGLFFIITLRSDAIADAIKNDRIIKIVFMIEKNGKPISTQVLLYYASLGRCAFLDIPNETGLIIKSLKRVDRIDALYSPKSIKSYIDEVGKLVGADLHYYMVCEESQFIRLVDLVDGLKIFIPNVVDTIADGKGVILPSGAMTLDGKKMADYATYTIPDESDIDRIERKHKTLQSLLRRIGELKDYVVRTDVFPILYGTLKTNIDQASLKRLFSEFARLDVERVVKQRTTGVYRNIDGRLLLDPHYDGELVKDIVKQTLNALVNAETFSVEDKIFTIEILNGSGFQGLAKKTSDIFQSFGYEVISVKNAERQDYEYSTIYDRFRNEEGAKTIAGVIRCKSVVSGAFEDQADSVADFQIVLGKDFNGRYCVY